MTVRSFFFWPHLVAGASAGAIILIMSVTGVLLTYEKQMIAWADRQVALPGATGPRLPPEDLLARVEAHTGALPVTMVVPAEHDRPLLVSVQQRMLVIDPWSGAVIGESAPRMRRFFRVVTDWHRWLATGPENRTTGRGITGWSNALFLFLVLSGMYLWMPRRWTWRHVRAVGWFTGRLSGKARDFNWHNAIGIWCAIPLFFVVISAMPISFPWANALLFRAVGETAPAPAGRGGPPPAANASASRGRVPLTGLNAALTLAEAQVAGWRTITIRPPASAAAPFTFTIDRGGAGQPQYRGTLTVPRNPGAAPGWEPFEWQSRGRRLRSISRFLHTGEVLGLAGQTVAGIASLGGAVLVWTGIALAWRRFFSRVRVSERDRERKAA